MSRAAIDQILGAHPSIQEVRRLARKAAASPARSILIYGETGTGKGLLARAIHELSRRAHNTFVDINCAAIPAELVESEMFGYERGAFTGAAGKKIGLVEAAHTGSLFLDEIRELSPVLQAKLLTLIDTQRFRRIGSVQPINVDVRFITATNRVLLKEVTEGRFREDLYYRLQVIAINIPPLRERGNDILSLAEQFLDELSQRYERQRPQLSAEVKSIFCRYRWPGNVREMQHLLERIVALEETETVTPEHLPARVLRDLDLPGSVTTSQVDVPSHDFHILTQVYQRALINTALSAAGGSLVAAAERLGLTRHALRHQMLKLGIRVPPQTDSR